MGNKEFYEEAIASNSIPNASNTFPEGELDNFGRKKGEVAGPDTTKTFTDAEHFLKEYGDKCGVKGDLSLALRKFITVTLNNDDSDEKYKVRIITAMRDGYRDCITGEKIDQGTVQCIPGKLEDFFDRKEYGYRYYNGYCAIFFLNKEKWESLKKELTDMLIS